MIATKPSPKAARVVYELALIGGAITLGLAWTWHEPWTEVICGILLVVAWLVMNGSSPLGWLMAIGICSITEEHYKWFYSKIIDTFGDMYDGYGGLATGIGMFVVFLSVYLIHGFSLLPFDMWTIAHEAAKPLKIQPDVNIASKLQVGKLARTLAVNFLVSFLYTLASTALVVWSRGSRGWRITENLPSKSEQFVCFVVGLLWNEFMFYYSHRLMHRPWWYRRFHKQHHEYTAPFALAAIYSTPVEHLVCNLWAFLGICDIWRFHSFFVYCWIANAIMGTQTHHSGYRWPWMTILDHQPNVHDLHHQLFNVNFGNIGLLDSLHGTQRDPFAAHGQQKIK